MEEERLELVVAEDVDPLLEALGVVEIAEEDGEPLALVLRDEGAERIAEVGMAFGLELAQKAEDLEDARFAARRRRGVVLAQRKEGVRAGEDAERARLVIGHHSVVIRFAHAVPRGDE